MHELLANFKSVHVNFDVGVKVRGASGGQEDPILQQSLENH